jgi:hypothetical protein
MEEAGKHLVDRSILIRSCRERKNLPIRKISNASLKAKVDFLMKNLTNDRKTKNRLQKISVQLKKREKKNRSAIVNLQLQICDLKDRLQPYEEVYYSALAAEILNRFASKASATTSNTQRFGHNLNMAARNSLSVALDTTRGSEKFNSFLFSAKALVDERNNVLHFVANLDEAVTKALLSTKVNWNSPSLQFPHQVFQLYEDGLKNFMNS